MPGFASNKPSGNSDWQGCDVRKRGLIIFRSAEQPALASAISSSSLAPGHASLTRHRWWQPAEQALESAWPPFPDQQKVALRARLCADMAYIIPSENIQGWKSLFSKLAELEPEQKY